MLHDMQHRGTGLEHVLFFERAHCRRRSPCLQPAVSSRSRLQASSAHVQPVPRWADQKASIESWRLLPESMGGIRCQTHYVFSFLRNLEHQMVLRRT